MGGAERGRDLPRGNAVTLRQRHDVLKGAAPVVGGAHVRVPSSAISAGLVVRREPGDDCHRRVGPIARRQRNRHHAATIDERSGLIVAVHAEQIAEQPRAVLRVVTQLVAVRRTHLIDDLTRRELGDRNCARRLVLLHVIRHIHVEFPDVHRLVVEQHEPVRLRVAVLAERPDNGFDVVVADPVVDDDLRRRLLVRSADAQHRVERGRRDGPAWNDRGEQEEPDNGERQEDRCKKKQVVADETARVRAHRLNGEIRPDCQAGSWIIVGATYSGEVSDDTTGQRVRERGADAVLGASSAFGQAAQTPKEPPPKREGGGELSLVNTTGNTDASAFGAGADFTLRPGKWVYEERLQYIRTEDSGIVDAESLTERFRAGRVLNPRLNVFAEYGYLRDIFSGIDHRNTISGGLAFAVIDSKRQTFNIDGSIGDAHEERPIDPTISTGIVTGGPDTGCGSRRRRSSPTISR